ncbi:Innexin shaking-B [Cryptotermes secundus]|uniref:Innexin n=1 Tax=Cryptotermes secundus TaxID=105785 RepID=A0A2J7PH95_9NEOP|nr:innexin shaking-B [Cryptotermes secundus]XP_033611183.1 innexin shaking-B [Cryptotermes secundus]PNF15700.1 Innexin shaking-B [Cryptotermes secundus]
MLDIFKRVLTFFRRQRIQTDSFVFRLHHSATVALLLIFCLIVGLNQYVRSPINCSTETIPRAVLDAHCWSQSTFTVPEEFQKKTGSGFTYPGVATPEGKGSRRTKFYYPWVFLSLFFQAILFYIPGWLWKNWEGGKLQALRMDLNIGFVSKEEKAQKKEMLVDYLHENMNNHTWWACRYLFCEVLAFINIIGQIFFMDHFLGGEFWSYGSRVLSFMASDDEGREDPMTYVFPKTVKCTFHNIGASGTLVRYDSLCVLPLNALNGKIYTFLWFWLIVLLIFTSVWFIFTISIITSSKFRIYVLRKRFGHIDHGVLAQIDRRCGIGDWFLFCMLGENLDSRIFRDVMEHLVDIIGKRNGSMMQLTEHL